MITNNSVCFAGYWVWEILRRLSGVHEKQKTKGIFLHIWINAVNLKPMPRIYYILYLFHDIYYHGYDKHILYSFIYVEV